MAPTKSTLTLVVKRQNETARATRPQHSEDAADVECARRIAEGDAARRLDQPLGAVMTRHRFALLKLRTPLACEVR